MNFSEFFDMLNTYPSMKSVFSFWDVFVNFVLPAGLMLPVSVLYKKTHKGVTYNQAFAHTMFIMSVTTAIIMMIIGSNIARAFSLVGALSIIRFRTAVKDSRDTGYIFCAIAIGMACGTGMYLVAIEFTVLFCALMFALTHFKVGEKIEVDKLLKVELPSSVEQSNFDSKLKEFTDSFSLVHSEVVDDKGKKLNTYIITTKNGDLDDALITGLKSSLSLPYVSLYYNDQRVEV